VVGDSDEGMVLGLLFISFFLSSSSDYQDMYGFFFVEMYFVTNVLF
jgi:hypothetical protein